MAMRVYAGILYPRQRRGYDRSSNLFRIPPMTAPPSDTPAPNGETSHRPAEVLFRALVEQLPAVTYIAPLDPSLPATYVSPQIARLGYAPEEWLADPELWVKLLHPLDRERVLAEFGQGIAAGGPISSEYRLVDRDGHEHWFKDTATVIRDAEGRPAFIQGVMLDIGERKQREAAEALAKAQLQALGKRMESVREEERTRIAREVHDELGQSLTALRLELAVLGAALPQDPALAARVASMDELIGRTVDTVRRISYELRPGVLDTLGLIAAIEWQTREFERRSGIACELALPAAEPEIRPNRATAIFRVFQEILTNIARHAGATQVDVCVSLPAGNLLLEVADNGRGFPAENGEGRASLGLLGMRERVAEFGGLVSIDSQPGRGTHIAVAVPMWPSPESPTGHDAG
jgi:two-component system sensor histidine kinase UhpB